MSGHISENPISAGGNEENHIYDEVEKFEMTQNKLYQDSKTASGFAKRNGNNYSAKDSSNKIMIITLFFIIVMLILGAVSAGIVFALEISNLKSEIASFQNAGSFQNAASFQQKNTSDYSLQNIQQVSQHLNTSIDQVRLNIVATDDRVQELNQALDDRTQQITQHIDLLYQEVNLNTNLTRFLFSSLGNPGQFSSYPIPSCAALTLSSPSGYYWVRASNGSAVRVYCDMTRSYGGVTGGWMRVAYLDMTNSSHQCPSGLRQHTFYNIRTCGINSNLPTCTSILLSVSGLEYSRLCGKIKAYQYGTPDAFTGHGLNTYYVDGISLTYGSRRQHIWTFAASMGEDGPLPYYIHSICPCINSRFASSATPPPSFVGNDYFCDTGSHNQARNTIYSANPLWDGAGCGPLNSCCTFNNPPWFYKQLPQPTTDDIEIRVCRDQTSGDEDILLEKVELYVY